MPLFINADIIFLYRDGRKGCHLLAEGEVVFVKEGVVVFVDDLHAADDLMDVVQGNADHGLCNDPVVIKDIPLCIDHLIFL